MRGRGRIELRARRALAVLLSGLGLLLIAFVFAATPLFVAGVALTGIGALAPLWVLATARGARARRILSAERVLEGATVHTVIEVHRSFAAVGWGRLEVVDDLTGERLRLGGASSPVRRVHDARIRLTVELPRRGEHTLAPPTIVASDPLDLARARTLDERARQTILVLPRTEPVRWVGSERGRRLDSDDGGAGAEALAATDLEGLRPYRPGAPASRIYWAALARGSGLIERRLRADGDERPLVVLDPRVRDPGGARDRDAVDAAVRAAASLVLELARRGGCGLLLPGQARPTIVDRELAAWPAVHARLAIVGTDADPHRSGRPGLERTSGPLIYVAAASYERLAAGLLASAGHGAVVLVVPRTEVVQGRPRDVRTRSAALLSVSGCQGFALGARRDEHHGRSAAAVASSR